MEGFPSRLYGWQGHPKMPRLVFALRLNERREDLAQLGDAWRRNILAVWHEKPPLRVRLGAAFGGGRCSANGIFASSDTLATFTCVREASRRNG